MTPEVRYRYIDLNSYTGIREVMLVTYNVTKITSKGAWILDDARRERFVLSGDGKRFAYENIEWAKHSYLVRKRRQLEHLTRAIAACNMCLRLTMTDLPSDPHVRVSGATVEEKAAAAHEHDMFGAILFERYA